MALTDSAIIQRYDENILLGITPTGTAPAAGYSLATYLSLNPAKRILYGATSITLTWATPAGLEGAIIAIPTSNLEGNVAVLSSSTGLSGVVCSAPVMTKNRIPKTLVKDFSSAPLSQRQPTSWTLTITGNIANVIMGGAILIYGPKGQLVEGDFLMDGDEDKIAAVMKTKNAYLTEYRQILRTQQRSITYNRYMSQAEEAKFSDWYDANWGSGYPSLVWPHPTENDAYFGTWEETYHRSVFERNPNQGRLYKITTKFTEDSKGQPV